ncbi:MAG: polyphosphate kinase 1, partial [Bdellovibrionota bacterium]
MQPAFKQEPASVPLEAPKAAAEFSSPDLYINRELSWIEFNAKVMEEAEDPSNRLLEKVKFLSITSSNFDEFFMIRVAGVKRQVAAGVEERGPDGLTPTEQFARISAKAHGLVGRGYKLWERELVPGLSAEGIEIVSREGLEREERQALRKAFSDQVFPILTPLAIDPGHPFPHLLNLSLNLAVSLERAGKPLLAVVQVPNVLSRLVPVPSGKSGRRFFLLEDLIAVHVNELFPGVKVRAVAPFRVTRDSDIDIAEAEAEDLLETIEKELREREWGRAVRLEVPQGAPTELVEFLISAMGLSEEDVYRVDGPIDFTFLREIANLPGTEHLKDPPHVPVVPPRFARPAALFDEIRRGDILLHHPYESFSPVIDFINRAADDPQVLAIKQTLYRTGGGDSPIVHALERAALNKKQVTALVELKARFDEANNIIWARALEEAGVHVVYGLIGLKTHGKITLVVRREEGVLRRYVHLATGNYNPGTARGYTDLGLLTANPAITDDASDLFNFLTGYSTEPAWQRFMCAPMGLEDNLIRLIEAETENARAGKPARIIAQMNALARTRVIRALYAASQAGVEIDLIVRGICMLRPGIPGV